VTTGGTITVRVEHPADKQWRITIDPMGRTRELIVHLPPDAPLASVKVDGKAVAGNMVLPVTAAKTVVIEVLTQ
jgi:hypothetical protein